MATAVQYIKPMEEVGVFNLNNDLSTIDDYMYKEIEKGTTLTVAGVYPNGSEFNEQGLPKYRYETSLEVIDFDERCDLDIAKGIGFFITESQGVKKIMKSDNSIMSSKYGMGYDDMTPFGDVYKCKCGHTTMKLNEGTICDVCHTKVEFVSNNFETVGWIKIKDPFFVIQPNMYMKLKSFIGNKFVDMLEFKVEVNEDGFISERTPKKEEDKKKNNPFYGIGMLEFRRRFDEILEYYYNKKKKDRKKMDLYDDIMQNYKKIFCHSVPVYTLLLRPVHCSKNVFTFEGNNAAFNIMAGLAKKMNNDKIFSRGRERAMNELLYKFQSKYMDDIYKDLEKQIAQKKGHIRSVNGGRYNFTGRNVIIPDPKLAIDEIILPYTSLVELLGLTIVNILTKTYSPCDAYAIWDRSRRQFDPSIYKIIQSILASGYVGIILNRNPSISPASIIQMRVTGVTPDDSYAARVPLEILKSMGADFDGDTLNVMLIVNKEFLISTAKMFNPRLTMQLSSNDGMFNEAMQLQTDTVICLNSFTQLGIDTLTEQDLADIEACQNYVA